MVGMVGILIIAHAPLASAFMEAAQHVFTGKQEHLEVIDVMPDQNTEEVIQLARLAIARLNLGHGVLVLTDALGATPANCSKYLLQLKDEQNQVAILAGLNLPMLLRALTNRHSGLEMMTEKAQTGAHDGVVRLQSDTFG